MDCLGSPRAEAAGDGSGAGFMPAFAPSSFIARMLPDRPPTGRGETPIFHRRQHDVMNVQE
jgi:hypothetical protein